MIISNEKSFIYAAVPKTASTAMEKALHPYEDMHPETLYKKHAPFWEIKDQYNLNDYFTFCFFRNPWDLLVSKYFFHKQGWNITTADFCFDMNDYTFERFITDEDLSKLTYEYHHLYTQTDYVRGVSVDMIYKYEELPQAIEDINSRLGLHIQLDTKNQSQHEHYARYYSEATRAIVSERWRESIERMGYVYADS